MTRSTLHACLALSLAFALQGAAAPEAAAEEHGDHASLLGLEARRLNGDTESLDRYRGQVLLVVNTASRCGYTPQYEGLQALYARFESQGFSVLGFPSNDFGRQEPGGDAEIREFCRLNYGVKFPMFSKVSVKGPDAHPVYVYLTSLPEPIGGPVQWNFQKYLVDRNGTVVARYASRVRPQDPGLVGEIERLLSEPRPESPEAGLAP
jgi:glutathione peroxidase